MTGQPASPSPAYTARLLIGCPDRPGIVAAVSGFLFEQGANIVSSQQYSTDPIGGRFFLRTEFFLPAPHRRRRLRESIRDGPVGSCASAACAFAAEVAARFAMDWQIRWPGQRRRIAILVSRHDHCLVELLWRWRRGELDAEIVAVISNHPDLEPETRGSRRSLSTTCRSSATTGQRARGADAASCWRGRSDLLVLARYMQILSGDFLARLGMPAINIHHSFLPAFAGADPYRRAREQGVKLIGATAHYVTEQLDDGPIIEQDVVRVDHRQSVDDLERVGRDIERLVLARAVSLHLDDRVIVDGRRTIVL